MSWYWKKAKNNPGRTTKPVISSEKSKVREAAWTLLKGPIWLKRMVKRFEVPSRFARSACNKRRDSLEVEDEGSCSLFILIITAFIKIHRGSSNNRLLTFIPSVYWWEKVTGCVKFQMKGRILGVQVTLRFSRLQTVGSAPLFNV